MWPISVPSAVATTTPRPWPATTSVPAKAIEARSPNGAAAPTGTTALATGTDSPVSAASCTASCAVQVRRRSAGTRSPASISTMSPGTTSAAGSVTRWPSRSSATRGASIFRIAASAFSARCRFSFTISLRGFHMISARYLRKWRGFLLCDFNFIMDFNRF